MAGYKNGKIMLPIKEFLIVKGQATYELNTIDMTKVTVFYRKYNQEAFLETYSEMPKGDYRINEVGGNKQLEITNLDILDKYYSIQLCRVVDLTSSQYSPSGQVDPITLNQHLNEVIADVTFLFTYLKDVGMVMDSSSGNKIMAELKPYTTWYMDKDGNMAAMPVDSLFEKFNDLVQELRQEVLKLLEQDLEVAERELLEGVKTQLDEYVETDLKQRLDDYTTQLEERLQTMIDQAVADKGLMPEGSDWLEIGLGNWLVVDLFNKNYIHYPPQLNSSDNAGVVKKDITDGGKSQVIRFYTTTGKMLFIVRVNEVWSEWQELGEQTDTMQFTQANHGFVFTAVTLDGATRKWVKANKYTSADGIAIKIDNDRFDVATRGVVNIPTSARDDKGEPFVYDEYYFLSQEVDGGLSRTKNEIGTFQYLAHISEIDNKQVAYIDIGDSYDLDYEVVDTETADRVGIGTYKTTLRTADTIEDLKRLNLKVGDVVEVLGYYTKGDGADHKRKIESKDDGSGVLLDNSLYANIIHNGEVNVSWFGAKGDGVTDDSDIVDKINNYITNDITLKIPFPLTYTKKSGKLAVLDFSKGVNNISIDFMEKGEIIVDVLQDSGAGYMGGLYFKYPSNNITLINPRISWKNKPNIRSIGDGIMFKGFPSDDNTISNIKILGKTEISKCSQTGLIFLGCKNISVDTVELNDIWADGVHFNACKNGYVKSIIGNSTGDDTCALVTYFDTTEVTDKGVRSPYHQNGFTEWCNNNIVVEQITAYNGSANALRFGGTINSKIGIINTNKPIACNSSKKDSTHNWTHGACQNCFIGEINTSSQVLILNENIEEIDAESVIAETKLNIDTINSNLVGSADTLFALRVYKLLKNSDIAINNLKCNSTIKIHNNSDNTNVLLCGDNQYENGNGLIVENQKSKTSIDLNIVKYAILKNSDNINCNFKFSNLTRLSLNQIQKSKISIAAKFNEELTRIPLEILKPYLLDLNIKFENYNSSQSFFTLGGLVEGSNLNIMTNIAGYGVTSLEELTRTIQAGTYAPKNYRINIEYLNSNNEYKQMKTEPVTTEILETPTMQYAMELEGVKQDYLEYSLEKFKYEKQLEEEQKAKQEAYQQALTTNPNLTYKEFIASYPMMLSVRQEPTIPQSVQEFMKKYL